MVHSLELLLDSHSESAIHAVWQQLSDAGLRAPGPASRPHATLVVAEQISAEVDSVLAPLREHMPLPCVIGAPMLFGGPTFTLVRLMVPSAELLSIQAQVYSVSAPYLSPGPLPNSEPGKWTPHLTLARRVTANQLAEAFTIRRTYRDLHGSVVGLRRWDGGKRVEYLI